MRRWDEEIVEGLTELGGACPDLKHLKIEQCSMKRMAKYEHPPKTCLQLETLSLAGSKWTGIMGFAGYHLKQLDVSGTNITDSEFRRISEVHPTPGASFD